MAPSDIKEIYLKGENISSYLRNKYNMNINNEEIIEIAYDLQAGNYTKNILNSHSLNQYYVSYTQELFYTIQSLCNKIESIMEAGIGEATTLANLLDNYDKNIKSYGFDISYSRLLYAKKYLDLKRHNQTKIVTGSLLNIPFLDNSIDVVYTSHSLEPNRGYEKEMLQELYRVTKKYLILLEPAYELSNKSIQQRMDKHGYCMNLEQYCLELGFNIIEYKLFKYYANAQNPTAILIIKKDEYTTTFTSKDVFACPKYKTPLKIYKNQAYYSDKSLILYPIINDIPCLRVGNGILATMLDDSEYL